MLRSVKRAPANVRALNNISDVIFFCSVGERSRALALLNAARVLVGERSDLILPCNQNRDRTRHLDSEFPSARFRGR